MPTPYIPYSYIPLSAELVAWLWCLGFVYLIIAYPVRFSKTQTRTTKSPITSTSAVISFVFSYYLAPPHARRAFLLSYIPGSLARTGYTFQTLHNCIELARAADLFDCVLIVPLFAVVLRFTRSDPRHFIWPITFRRAEYIANRASQIAYITFAARRSPAIYFGLPLLLLGIVILYHLKEDWDDARRRAALGPDPNRLNPAARMPPEVQLQIFHYVRTLRRFAERDAPILQGAIYLRELQPLGRWTGLSAGCSVCRSWRDAATEVLYSDVFLPNAGSVLAFAVSLDAHPDLSRLVRRIALPVSGDIPSDDVECIIRNCSAATDLACFDADTNAVDIPGLALAADRLVQLAITWGPRVPKVDDSAYLPPQCDVLGTLERFPMLEQLSLCAARIQWKDDISLSDAVTSTRFRAIRSIRLDACLIYSAGLMQLMLALPNLRTAALRNVVVIGREQLSASAVFARQRRTLEELDLSSTHVRFAPAPLRLDPLDEFCALRVLALDAHALQHLTASAPLPALERLVLSFAPYSTHMRRTRRHHVFLTVDRIRRLDAPFLREVQIWDEVHLTQIYDWKIAAFMLREMLQPGVDVAVNLSLEWVRLG